MLKAKARRQKAKVIKKVINNLYNKMIQKIYNNEYKK